MATSTCEERFERRVEDLYANDPQFAAAQPNDEICQALDMTGDYGKGDEYWVKATAWEAYAGLEDQPRAEEWKAKALAVDGFEDWMRESTEEQIGKLTRLLAANPAAE